MKAQNENSECTHSLGHLSWESGSWATWNNRNFFSHGSGHYKSIKVWRTMLPLKALGQSVSLPLQLLVAQAVLAYGSHNYNLCLCLPVAFFPLCSLLYPCQSNPPSLSLYKDTTDDSSVGPPKSWLWCHLNLIIIVVFQTGLINRFQWYLLKYFNQGPWDNSDISNYNLYHP